nr:alkene reductase [Desulfobulbaceae bacterium]
MTTTHLFKPLSFGELTVSNRVALAPMTRGRAGSARIPGDLMAEYYLQRAGAGLIITEASVISTEGIGWIDSPGIYSTAMVDGWRMVTERVKPTATPMFLQLWHCGRASHSDFHGGSLPQSASAVKLNGDHIHTPRGNKPYETPRAMTVDEIHKTVDDYRRAAENAKKAGFDGVEVHGANGYLINQFLDGSTNLRTDQYGGSLENRFRFFREVLEAVLEVWPAERVGARISPNGVFNDMGCDDFRELFLYVTGEINKLKLGYLHIMDGLAFGFHGKGEPMTLAEFRPLYDGVIIGNCGYSRDMAEKRLAEGTADIIAIGRPYISNPDLVERFRNNWPLNPCEDMSLWYTSGPEGYTDYEPYRP